MRDALREIRDKSVLVAEQLRSSYKVQITDVDYNKMFFDSNLVVELQLRELSRTLLILDRSVVANTGDDFHRTGYTDGSFVKHGTVVLSGWHRQMP